MRTKEFVPDMGQFFKNEEKISGDPLGLYHNLLYCSPIPTGDLLGSTLIGKSNG